MEEFFCGARMWQLHNSFNGQPKSGLKVIYINELYLKVLIITVAFLCQAKKVELKWHCLLLTYCCYLVLNWYAQVL
jgi:hypothetical protein